MLNQILTNRIYLSKITTSVVSGICAVVGFIGLFAPLNEIFPCYMSICARVIISIAILAAGWCVTFFIAGWSILKKPRHKIISGNGGHALYLQYGDIFDEAVVVKPSGRRNIVIPVNRCFDVHVDDHLISAMTIHGDALNRVYSSGRYTEESISAAIERQLSGISYDCLTPREKPEGNMRRYPAGTVVDLAASDKGHYFLWALSEFDRDLNAQTSMEEYAVAIQRLIESCNRMTEGYPVVIPIAGAGLSRTGKDQQDLLRYLLSAFRLNWSEINCDVHIVVRNDVRDELPIMGMK